MVTHMKHFYKRVKWFYAIAVCFLGITIIPATIANFINREYQLVVVACLTLPVFVSILSFILIYYRNIVIEVTFDNNNTIIKTNSRRHVIPSKYFVEVINANYRGKIFLKYDDGTHKKTFAFQTKYSPFITHSLDFDEMRRNMTSANFIGC